MPFAGQPLIARKKRCSRPPENSRCGSPPGLSCRVRLFRPSSAYLRTHTYRQYLAEAQAAPYSVVAYQIVRVSYIEDNKNPKSITTASRIARWKWK